MRARDLTGQRFGRLEVRAFEGRDKRRNSLWQVACDCGETKVLASDRLTSGHTQSCGCLHREQLADRNRIHGLVDHELYGVWQEMRQRCGRDTHPDYHLYGGRGIRVCEQWEKGNGTLSGFECFLLDVGERPTSGLTLDRKDNDGNYEPGNVRWATRLEQSHNSRRYSGYGAHLE